MHSLLLDGDCESEINLLQSLLMKLWKNASSTRNTKFGKKTLHFCMIWL